MSNLTQRIIDSHKASAKRLAKVLFETKNVTMSTAESLELVACVLGVKNWQTLLALAHQRKGPRITEKDSSSPIDSPTVSINYPEKLQAYYETPTGWGNHPFITRERWQHEVDNGDTGSSYWGWVFSLLDEMRSMFPWELDQDPRVAIAKIAGWSTIYGGDRGGEFFDGWSAQSSDDRNPAISDCDTELEAWAEAAETVIVEVCEVLNIPEAQWQALSHEEKIDQVTRWKLLHLPGEMSRDARKYNFCVKHGKSYGINVTYSEVFANKHRYWTAAAPGSIEAMDIANYYEFECVAWDTAWSAKVATLTDEEISKL